MPFPVLFPYLLVFFRLTLAPAFWIAYFLNSPPWLYVTFLLAGIFSDIFDGILARRWGTSTPHLRRLDSNVDTLFYGCSGLVAVLLQAAWLHPWFFPLLVMFLFMVIHNLVALVRYGRQQPSYHMYSGKLWSIVLVVTLITLFLGHPSVWALNATIFLGLYNSTEGILASLISPKPLTDVPSIFHVLKIVRTHKEHSTTNPSS